MILIGYVVGTIVILNLVYGLLNWWKASFFKGARQRFMALGAAYANAHSDNALTVESHREYSWLIDKQTLMQDRLAEAGVPCPISRLSQTIGSERVTANFNLIKYMDVGGPEQMILRVKAMEQARGHFKTRAQLNFNPLHWLDMLFNLPLKLAAIQGDGLAGKSHHAVRLLNFVYQAIIVILTLREFSSLIQEVIATMQA